MPDILPFPDKRYTVIYADPPWAYRQAGATQKARGTAVKHYPTMTTAEICAMPGGVRLFSVGHVPEHRGRDQGPGGVGV